MPSASINTAAAPIRMGGEASAPRPLPPAADPFPSGPPASAWASAFSRTSAKSPRPGASAP
jgi:hypothetical protein